MQILVEAQKPMFKTYLDIGIWLSLRVWLNEARKIPSLHGSPILENQLSAKLNKQTIRKEQGLEQLTHESCIKRDNYITCKRDFSSSREIIGNETP